VGVLTKTTFFALVCGLFAAGGLAGTAEAQGLADNLRSRAIESSVLLTMDTGDGSSEGSGSIIDHRGYVLTNFHVVGHVHPFDGGMPGALFREDGLVTIARTTSSRVEARPTWLGHVVRTDPSADLALIRIDQNLDGTPLAPGATFPWVPIASSEVELSDEVFALGYPLGMRSVTLTSGRITGLDVDADGALAYLRVDAEFNPGNSGGMLLDSAGRLVGVPTLVSRRRSAIAPIRKARPIERIPVEWKRALAAGPITDVRLTPVLELSSTDLSVRSVGAGLVVESEELFFLRVPDGYTGSIQLGVDRSLEVPVAADAALISLDRPRATIRTAANNVLSVHPTDGRHLVVVMAVRRRRADGTQPGASQITARLVAGSASGSVAVMAPMGAPSAASTPYAARPAELEEHTEVGTSSFRLQGGLVIDPLDGQSFAGGGVFTMGMSSSAYAFDSIWPLMISFDYGMSVVGGMWRDDFLFAGFASLGVRIALGSPKFMVELPVAYRVGAGLIEDAFSFSPYGYEIGVNARIHNIAFGVSWAEAHRGNFSVLRTLEATLWCYF
jgi:hypothetical protein